MSQGAVEEPIGQDTGQEDVSQGIPAENSQQEGTGINPAWNDLLQALPSSLHSQVTPYLQKWDQNYQEGIGKVHSEYEPWKPFKESGVAPEQVHYGLQLLEKLENSPEEIFEALKQYLQVEDEQQQVANPLDTDEQGQQSPSIDLTAIPEFQQMTEMTRAMAELLVQQQTEQSQAQADQEVEAELTAAREKYGDFDEKWVITQLLANDNLTIDQAVNNYQEFVRGILTQNNRPGPKVLSPGGGGVPNPGVNPSQLDDKGRRSLIADMLAAGKNASQG